jgi:DNA-binding helix-hairpin-helix protein with protein kinase domain
VVVGDVSATNVLFDSQTRVGLIDADSFQITVGGRVLPCRVGTLDTTPGELQSTPDFSKVIRTREHDAFGIGTLIFQLLSEGTHPFAGEIDLKKLTKGDLPPAIGERIAGTLWPHSKRHAKVKIIPPRGAVPFASFPESLQELFVRTFDGPPNLRPTADEYSSVLADFIQQLVPCKSNPRHYYYAKLPECPWCQRSSAIQYDPFAKT